MSSSTTGLRTSRSLFSLGPRGKAKTRDVAVTNIPHVSMGLLVWVVKSMRRWTYIKSNANVNFGCENDRRSTRAIK